MDGENQLKADVKFVTPASPPRTPIRDGIHYNPVKASPGLRPIKSCKIRTMDSG